jgi:hypothetical protein
MLDPKQPHIAHINKIVGRKLVIVRVSDSKQLVFKAYELLRPSEYDVLCSSVSFQELPFLLSVAFTDTH